MLNSTCINDWLGWASGQNFLRMNTAELVWNVVFYNTSKIGPTKDEKIVEGTSYTEQFGITTIILLAIFIKYEVSQVKEILQSHKVNVTEWFMKILCFLVTLVQLPFLIATMFVFWCMKKRAEKQIKQHHGEHFKGFLEGQDVVWSIETDKFRSVINVLAQIAIDTDEYEPIRTSAKILRSLKERISSELMQGHAEQPKMFYQRKCESGFYFWSNESPAPIDTYIRYMTMWSNESEFLTEDMLRSHISGVANSSLPENHTRMWEMLVSKQPVKTAKNSQKVYYAILFRVNHALGDGVALLRLLLEAMADKKGSTKKLVWTKNPRSESIIETLSFDKLQKLWNDAGNIASIIFETPYRLARLAWMYPWDKNFIHPTVISGEKVLSWIHESDTDFSVLEAVKSVKRQLPGLRFSDVLTTALSKSLHKYFSVKGIEIPEYISIVVPARMAREGPVLQLKNRFSVAMQKLPINFHEKSSRKIQKFYESVEKVRIESEKRTASSDYLINYWIMSFVASIMPAHLFGKLLECNPSTLAFSNLPGPQETVKIEGLSIEKIGFFLPNFNTTAVGLTVLSYGSKLQLGLLADKNAIRSEEDAGLILKQMIEEIRQMKNLLAR